MPNYIRLPDGSLYEAPDGATPLQAYEKARQDYPEVFGITPPEPETGFVAGLKSGFQSLKGDIGAIGAGLGVEGAAEYAKAQREKAAQIAQTPELTEDPWGYVTTLLGQSAAYMAAPIAGAALVGSAPVSGALGLGTLGAGLLGAGAVSATQFTGSNLSRQLEEGTAPEDLKLGAAVAAAIPQAALDTAALRFVPGVNKLLGKWGRELTKEESLNAARKLAEASAAGLIKAGGIKTAQVAGVEGLTEAGQQVFERMQAGLDLMDEQARGEYIDNFVGGATLGGLFGAGSRIGAQSRAKQELAAEDQRIADEKADAEEKARNEPEALLQLNQQFTETKAELDRLNTALKQTKPTKKSSPEEKAAYDELKKQRDELAQNFRPLLQEYTKRKSGIEAALAAQQPAQEEAAPPPPAAPVGSGITLSDQYDTLRKQVSDIQDQLAAGPDLDTQDALITQLEETQAKMQELAPTVIERGGVTMSEQDLAEAEQGLTREETTLKAKLDETEKGRLVALEQMDLDKAKKAGEKVRELQAQLQELPGKRQALDPFRQRLEELRARQTTPVGETTEMFTTSTEGEKVKTAPVKFENIEGAPITGMPTAKREAERAIVREEKTAVPKEQVAQVKQLENNLATVVKSIPRNERGEITGRGIPELNDALFKLNEAQNKLSRTINQDERAGDFFNNTFDIFSASNLLREAISRGDERTILNITRANDSKALNALLDEKKTERDRLADILGKKMDADTRGVKRERANLFDAFYPDPKERARFANGTNEEKIERQKVDKNGSPVFNKKTGQPVMERIRLQDVYDKGGKAAVEYEIVMDRVADLVRTVTKPQGNAKKSLYTEAVDLYNQIEELKAQQASGIDTPTLGDKAKDLNAKFGKGEPAGERQLTKMGAYNLQRKIDGLTNRYNALIGKITPIRDKVLAEYQSLYVTTKTSVTEEEAKNIERAKQREAKKAAQAKQERSGYLRDLAVQYGEETDAYKKYAETTTNPKLLEEKALELGKKDKRFKKAYEAEMEDRREAGEIAPKVSKSRGAATQARIARGNLRPEAEKDLATRNVARDIGFETKEFEQFSEGLSKKLDALRKKYGESDPAVQKFKFDIGAQRVAKAIEIGKKTPAYRQALAEQTKKLQEASAGAAAAGFPQAIKSKRTTQETRKASGAPKTFRTGEAAETARIAEELRNKTPAQKRKDAEEARAVADELAKSAASARKKPKDFYKLFDEADDASFLREQSDAYDAPSYTKVKINVSKALQAGDAVKAAELLAENGSTPVVRKLAGVLSSLLGNTKVEMVSDLYVDDKRAAGNYIPRTGVLQFDEEAVSEETVLHEMIHAATIRALKAPVDTLTDDQKAARKELESMFASLKSNTKLAREYGMTDIAEFAAEMMSNRVLQDKLSTVRWTGGGNFFTRFINKVLAFLGFKDSVDFNKQAADNILRLFERAMPMTEGKQIDNVASVLRGVFPGTAPTFSSAIPANVRAAAQEGVGRVQTAREKVDASFFSPSAGLAWRTQLLDRFAPIEALLKKGVDRKKLSDMQLFQTLYYLRFGEQRSQYVAQAASNGPVQRIKQPDGTFTIESVKGANLAKIAETLRGAGVGNEQAVEQMFTTWLAGLRAGQGAIGWDKLNFKNPEKAKANWDEVNSFVQSNEKLKAAFESARKQYREYNAGLLDFLADTGAVSREESARLQSLDYVPFYRVDGDAVELIIDKEKAPVRIGNIKDQPYLRELVGGEDAILPFFTSALQNTNMLLDMGLRNLQTKDVANVLAKGLGYAQIRKGAGPQGTNIIRFRDHGNMMHAVINEDMDGIPADLLVKGMEGIKATIPAVVRLMQYPANLLRKTVTLMPSYALRQAVRDPLNAWLVTGGNFTPIASSFKELGKMVGGKSSLEDTLQQAGAISSNVFTNDRQDMERILRNIAGGKGGWHSLVAKAEGFAIQGDSATRAVLYNMYRQKGMTHMQALLGSLESMNFSRRGLSPSMQFMSMMVPFFNAQVQGLDVLWRAGKGASLFEKEMHVRQTMLRRGLIMAAGTMAYAALMQDDDTYKNATPEQRALNWFVPIPGADVSLRVPIPFELGYAFKSIPEMFFNVAFGDEKAKDAVKTFGALMYNTVPVGLPQGIKPIVEVAANYNFFTGEPIEYGRMMGLQKSERYSANTTELAKYMSAVTGSLISPAQVDHLVRGYTSSLGITLMQIPDIALRPLSDQAERPTKLINEYPVIGTLFQPADGRGVVNAAYDRIEEFQQAKTTLNKLIEEGRQADARAFAQKYATEIAANSIGGSFRQQMGELAKLKRGIAGSKELTPDQKRDRIQQIKKLEIELARRIRAIE